MVYACGMREERVEFLGDVFIVICAVVGEYVVGEIFNRRMI